MPSNNTKISEMSPAEELNTTDLLMISQQDAEVETEFHTKNATIGDLADEVVTGIQFTNDLNTNDKTIIGAINEAAAVGKISEYYKYTNFSSDYGESGGYSHPQWKEYTVEEGHQIYYSYGDTYACAEGESLCTFTVSGYSDVTFYIKQDGASAADTDKAYVVLGNPNTPIDIEDEEYAEIYKGKVLDGYVSHKFENLYGQTKNFQVLYHADSLSGGGTHTTHGYVYMVPGEVYTTQRGEVFNNYTSNFAVNSYAHAEGTGNLATGYASHVEGDSNTVNGDYAHAEGNETTASNHAAHAEGNGTLASGSNSHAEGDYTQAVNNYAHAEGEQTTASGQSSHAEGNYTTASAYTSHAEGDRTTASGQTSHAEGLRTTASGRNSHAEGYNTIAGGEDSHVEGYESQASGNYCHAEGYTNVAGYQGAHAEGSRNVASKLDSHAEGESTKAIGVGAHSEGGYTTASGKFSHAEGSNLNYNTEGPIASGVAAHAEGILTKAEGFGSHAEGMPAIKYQEYSSTKTYNTNDIVYYFPSQDNSSTVLNFARAKVNNIQGISPEDSGSYQYWEGCSSSDLSSYYYSNNGNYSSTAIGKGAHAEGVLTIASGDGSHAEGGFTSATAYFGHAEGNYTEASGNFAHAEGMGNSSTHNIASGVASHVEGSQSKASGDFSHAEGQFAYAIGQESHAENSGTYAYGMSSHAEGAGTVAYSEQSHVEGSGSYAYGGITHVEGAGNITTGSNAHVEGSGNRNLSFSSHTEGAGNYNYGPQSHVEGAGNTLSGEEGHAEGAGNNVHGPKNHVECGGNTIFGLGSHVEGKHNIAVGFSHHAEGWLNSIGVSSSVNYFSPNTTYEVDDIVAVDALFNSYNEENSNFLYKCITAPGQIQSDEGVEIITPTQWNNSTAYPAGSVVYVQFNWYPCYLVFYCSSAVEAGMNPLTNGKNYWSTINNYLSPMRGTSSSGYYLLTIPTSSSLKVAKVAANTTIEPMWEPVATNLSAHVEGYKNIALGDYQHVQGKYNTPDTQKAFIIGNGSETEGVVTRSNAMTVDWDGNMAVAGDITVGVINGTIGELAARIPAAPTTDGTYVLSVTVSNGEPTYSWVASS